MKTAISIPNDVFTAAERIARQLSLSRSELYTRAIRNFIEQNSDECITRALNAVYSEVDSQVDRGLQDAQRRGLGPGSW